MPYGRGIAISPPGTRENVTAKRDEKSDLWTPTRTAIVGIVLSDMVLSVPVLSILFIGKLWLPLAVFCAVFFGLWKAIQYLDPWAYKDARSFITSSALAAGAIAAVLSMVWMDAFWGWVELGVQSIALSIRQVFWPAIQWYSLTVSVIIFLILLGPLKIKWYFSGSSVAVLNVAWTVYFYTEMWPKAWISYWPAIYERVRLVLLIYALPVVPWFIILGLRLAAETLAGDRLPVNLLPVHPLDVPSPLWMLFPHMRKEKEDREDEGPIDYEDRTHYLDIRGMGGPGNSMVGGFPMPKNGPEQLGEYFLAVLTGEATFSESGNKNQKGAIHYGYTESQWRGEAKDRHGRPLPGLRDSLIDKGIAEKVGNQKIPTPEGELFMMQWIEEQLGLDLSMEGESEEQEVYSSPDTIPEDEVPTGTEPLDP